VPSEPDHAWLVEMQYDLEFADPLVEVRDVVESYRCCGVTPTDWDQILDRAISTLDRLPQEVGIEHRLPDLLPHLRILLTEGLGSAPQLVDEVSSQVAAALSQVRIPGIPRPHEDYWGFNPPTVA
jgi:hypothetical protein